jgi:Holliday junction resolvase RusA-like endonuclease
MSDDCRRVLTLPYPPSVNRYWRHVGRRVLVSREGRSYRERVRSLLAATGMQTLTGRIVMTVTLHPPDRRTRDLDNSQKCLADSLARAGVFRDDSQIDDWRVVRGAPMRGGACIVEITECGEATTQRARRGLARPGVAGLGEAWHGSGAASTDTGSGQ